LISCRKRVVGRLVLAAPSLECIASVSSKRTARWEAKWAKLTHSSVSNYVATINEIDSSRHGMKAVMPSTTAPTAPSNKSDLVIEAVGVNHAYEGPDGWVNALENFEIAIPRNEFLCLLGPSGCGKSSFLRIVTGLMKPMEGEVRLGG